MDTEKKKSQNTSWEDTIFEASMFRKALCNRNRNNINHNSTNISKPPEILPIRRDNTISPAIATNKNSGEMIFWKIRLDKIQDHLAEEIIPDRYTAKYNKSNGTIKIKCKEINHIKRDIGICNQRTDNITAGKCSRYDEDSCNSQQDPFGTGRSELKPYIFLLQVMAQE